MESEIELAYELIVHCLLKYGGIEKQEAQKLIEDSGMFIFKSDLDRNLFLHEEPYFWAMILIYGPGDKDWYQDPSLWPPPSSYDELVQTYNHKS